MNTRNQIVLTVVMVALAAGAVAVFGFGGGAQEGDDPMAGHDHSAMSAGGDEAQPVHLTDDASRRIGVTYARIERGSLPRDISTVGFVTYDERRLATVNPKIDGWVENLYVDFTGAPVRQGQPLLDVYSPALVTAQEELILAKRLLSDAQARGGARAVDNAEELLAAARRRLAYWDIPDEDIRSIEERGEVTKTLTLRSPASGIVVTKYVVEGARIMPGMDLFEIADLSQVWVEAEVFEKDLSLINEGQHGMIAFEAYPGETFHGSVTYVYPTVSSAGRTGKVRLEMRNPGLRIKPGMYAQVDLSGPPMQETLLAPRTAVLETGERTIVFHRMADGQLHPMEVTTGLASGDRVQILSGISEGAVVATSATFLIDAESNLGAAMAGMAGMDHSGMDMGGEAAVDPSQMDHSQHQMGDTPPDTAGATIDHSQMDHSGHTMAPDTTAPDTAAPVMDHSQMDHSGHAMPTDTLTLPDTITPPDTTVRPDTLTPPDTTGATQPRQRRGSGS